MARLLRTQAALAKLEEFRARDDFDSLRDSYIETMCIQSIAVMCVSEIEEVVSAELADRLGRALDVRAGTFIAANLATIIKRTAKSDIAKTVRMFGPECRDRFNAAMEEQELRAYENLVTGRHHTAHAEGTNMGFVDLQKGIESAEKIVGEFRACIE